MSLVSVGPSLHIPLLHVSMEEILGYIVADNNYISDLNKSGFHT